MGLRLRQFKLLLWKNWLLQLRRPIGTVFEILVPLFFAALLLMARLLVESDVKCFSTYDNGILDEGYDELFSREKLKLINISNADIHNIDISSYSDKQLCDLGFCERLTYFPQNELTFSLMSMVSAMTEIPLSNRSFSSEDVMAKTAAEEEDNFYGAVVFLFDEDTTELPLDVQYRIRLSHTLTDFGTWYTDEVYPPFEEIGPRILNDYKKRFLHIQFALDRVITIAQSTNHDPIKALSLSLQMQQFPYPDYREDYFISIIQFMLPMLMVLAFIYSSGTIVKELVIEKESRLKESMKMMGLANWIHWLAWFVKTYAFLLVSTILVVLLLKFGKVFEYSNGIVLLLFFMLWMFASTMWGFMISVFFSKSRLGFIFALILWYLNFLPAQFLDYNKQSATVKTLTSLLSNTNMAFAMNIFARYESRGEGISWETISVTPSPGDSFNLSICFIMLAVDSLIYFLIMWYVEQVFPGQYGIPQPLYFPLQRSYWFGPSAHGANVNPNIENGIAMEKINKKNHEEAPNLEVGIDIKNLCKVYKSSVGKKLAVDDLSLKMYKGQITSLLGHNGAGKTTTMSILTGLFPPTSGTANIDGKSIISDIQSVRASLGLCPQHNVLFDRLTVKEHLDFFINLKGKSGEEADTEVKSMIQDLQLVDKTNTASSSLSGGMKRKLCCAIALIGGSQIVILDEPTSGMDPYARRATWDLLLKYKAGKTMVLTTHFMDEADLLGDRIAIMAHGQLLCSGSSLFLKNRYGVGYHMTLVKSQDCQVDLLTKTIQEYVPGSYLESNIGAELTYILPGESTSLFQKLFENLESERASLGVDSFGVSVTTLEEVFMKAGEAAEAKVNGVDTNEESGGASTTMQLIQEAEEKVDITQLETKREDLLSGFALKTQQFKAMFIKRFLNSKRDRKAVITQFFLPLLFIFCGLLIISVGDGTSNDPELELSLSILTDAEDNDHKAYYANFVQNTVHQAVFQDLESYLKALDIKPLNVESGVTKLATDNTGKVKGEIVTVNAESCCQYNFFILNASCALWLQDEKLDVCDEYPDFSYTNCKECINSTHDYECPIDEQTSNLSDPNTYFQEYVLQEDKDDTPGFFNEYVAGFTAVDTLFDAQQTVDDLVEAIGIQVNATFVDKLKSNDSYALASNITNGVLVTAWYSNEAIHTSAEVLNAISNVMLMSVTNSSYSIKAFNYPLPKSTETVAEDATSNEDTFGMAILIVFAMAFLTASFVGFIVTEKENKAKHLQFVSGVDTLSYWGATFAWDMCNYTIVYVIIIIIFAAYDLDAFGGENLGTVALIFFLYAWMSIPFTYTVSFLFKTPVTATALTTFLLAFVGMITVIAIYILDVLGEKITDELDYTFSLIPTHCLGRSLMVLSNNDALRRFCTASSEDRMACEMRGVIYQENNLAWDSPGVGKYCLYMAVAGLVFIILTLLIEVNFFIPARSASYLKSHVPNPDDEDVALERQKVSNINPQNDESAVLLKNLSKVYRKKPTPAVDQLCLSIPKGQCFGLLGVNGAGKTTTFGMLTGDLGITAGTAYMDGYDIQTQRRLVQQRIGYCPQFDALIERLTGREVLSMFARLRGIPSHQIDAVVSTTVTHLSLSNWADKLCGDYSGGNKRKLSTGIALVGNPPIMFLDEPTSGMDPTARRYLWNALTSIMKGGRSIVLTSHSMEECEVLCTRLAIMVNGQFKCLGSTQHLKSRYGKGYTMLIKMEENFQTGGLKQFVNDKFPGAVLLEEHQGVLQYQVENSTLSWSYIFGSLENNKRMLKIEDYSVSQTTLEQVFINFAKEQHEDMGHARHMSKKHKTEYIQRPVTGASLGRNSLRRSLRGAQSPIHQSATPQAQTPQSPAFVSENPPPPYNQGPQYTETYAV